ncbi:MAG: hypothetical protein H7146_01950 [Burkholderiaceae bacterium]|nr:hypothetical protein [Microbacteriaceae bacterium]
MIRILLVCSANICRSPYAEALLLRALPAISGLPSVAVSSAGTLARPGFPVCTTALAAVGAASDTATVAAHVSRRIDAQMVAGSDLVLTADSGHRGIASLLAPSASARIFTLAEAAALTTVIGARGVRPAHDDTPEARFGAWVAALDAARGLALPVRLPGQRMSRGERPGFDIADGHLQSRRRHLSALARVDSSMRAVTASLASTMNASIM